jgi:DNA-binding ferritin-like protein
MDKCEKVAALYVAALKGIYLIEQHSHWTTQGNDFYGDHLMFQRLYEAAQEDLDLAAEKFIGLFGVDCLDYSMQADLVHKVLLKYKGVEDPLNKCIAVEEEFVKFSKAAYDCFEKEGKMTLGLDDMVMSIASKREESLYLLRQAKGSE